MRWIAILIVLALVLALALAPAGCKRTTAVPPATAAQPAPQVEPRQNVPQQVRPAQPGSGLPTPPVKWSTTIGKTTYRSTIHVLDQRIVVNSNGDAWHSEKDLRDGLYVLSTQTGQVLAQIVPPGDDEKDVNGVALDHDTAYWGTDQGLLYRSDLRGNITWKANLGGDIEGAPVLADFNRDGVLDVAVGAEEGDFYAFSGRSGKLLFRFAPNPDDSWRPGFPTTAALFDATGDGVPDVFAPSRDVTMYAIDGASGELLWSRHHQSALHGAPIVVDTDGDGTLELVYTACYSELYAVDPRTGTEKWSAELEHPGLGIEGLFSPVGFHPQWGCVLIATAWWGEQEGLYCISEHGVHWRYTEPTENISSGVVIGDVDGKPGAEAIFGTESGRVIAVDASGTPVWVHQAGGPIECTPTLADIDGDGLLEVIAADNSGQITAIETRGRAPAILGYYRGSPHNDGALFFR